jgi:hypothetical protein
MPISHDGKPRCRHRREKYQNDIRKHALPSVRGMRRRLLRRAANDAYRAQLQIELELRRNGISWHTVAKQVAAQVQGKWGRLAHVRFDMPITELEMVTNAA